MGLWLLALVAVLIIVVLSRRVRKTKGLWQPGKRRPSKKWRSSK